MVVERIRTYLELNFGDILTAFEVMHKQERQKKKKIHGCSRVSANVVIAFAGPVSPPPLRTLPVQCHSLKVCVICQARVLS